MRNNSSKQVSDHFESIFGSGTPFFEQAHYIPRSFQ